jgi:hypothetical protein
MPGIIEGYNYDIFISYRQKKNECERARRKRSFQNPKELLNKLIIITLHYLWHIF